MAEDFLRSQQRYMVFRRVWPYCSFRFLRRLVISDGLYIYGLYMLAFVIVIGTTVGLIMVTNQTVAAGVESAATETVIE